ncbi:unnamed protein product [Didymodactylos carnosus]|uniref:Uncharacterized protein n=1 Tax=Didymodactylos carnosus TaxID=1234261 RepID=A0A813XL18_9BILA|nr:unnamed protein product [Didymodactylos carnosus]CAF0871455.1 unnamed protein product [Didymodactylos carnosus]CAF3603470.1 unnamed protein product [Didymodactylos carnosus]CAF3658770.1 unnamed protein product [Didymodactylos carnosus]
MANKNDSENYHRFVDKVCIVTGGASGIGYATVDEFCKEGATVAIFDFNEENGKKAEEKLRAEGKHVTFFKAVFFGSKGLTATSEDFTMSFSTNVSGYALMVKAVYPYMKNAGGKSCSIVNISSISAHRPQPDRWTYSSTKGAIIMMTKCMALDLSKDGIRVNSVSPGWTWSPEVFKAAVDGGREKWDPVWGQFHMLRRCADCPEIARPILFLCSNDASFITSTDLSIDGGYIQMTNEGFGEQSSFAGSKY